MEESVNAAKYIANLSGIDFVDELDQKYGALN
jgi:hypothetical protein